MAGNLEDLQQLHIDCVRELREYMSHANQTCKLLLDIKEFPISVDHRLQMLEQRRRENQALEKYQEARRRLFDAANWK